MTGAWRCITDASWPIPALLLFPLPPEQLLLPSAPVSLYSLGCCSGNSPFGGRYCAHFPPPLALNLPCSQSLFVPSTTLALILLSTQRLFNNCGMANHLSILYRKILLQSIVLAPSLFSPYWKEPVWCSGWTENRETWVQIPSWPWSTWMTLGQSLSLNLDHLIG